MTTKIYLLSGVGYLLALLLAFFWVSVPYYKAKWENTGKEFSLKKFWQASWNVNIGNIVFGVLLMIGVDMLLSYFPNIKIDPKLIPGLFILLAAFGAPIAMKKWGGTQKYFEQWVDKKLPVENPEKKP